MIAPRASLCLGLALAASTALARPPARPDPGEAVARVDGQVLTRAEIETRINGQIPAVRRKFRSLEARREFVERQIDLELLAAEARRRGLDADAEVRRVVTQALAQRLLELEEGGAAPDEAEIEAFWTAHAAEYARPATRRVAQILISPKKHGGKARARDRARTLYEEALAHRDDHAHFRELVELHTDDKETRLRGGDLRYFAQDDETIPEAVRDAAFTLAEIGDAAICESPLGFHVLRLIGRRPAFQPVLADVRDKVLRRLERERRGRAGDALIGSLRAKAAVEVDEKALRRVRVERP